MSYFQVYMEENTMKKLLALMLALCMLVSLASCGTTSSFGLMSDGTKVTVEAKNSDTDSRSDCELSLDTASWLNFDHKIEKGAISIKVLADSDPNKEAFSDTFSDFGGGQTYLEPGEYLLVAEAAEKETTGTVELTLAEFEGETSVLPYFYYYVDDQIETVAMNYFPEVISQYYEKADVSIPYGRIISVDDSNPKDILVKGAFYLDNFNLNEDVLECVSGGSYPGCVHLSDEGGYYVTTGFDPVEDGSRFDSSAKEIFGDDYDAFMDIYSDADAVSQIRKDVITSYIKGYQLKIKAYKDYGWDPVVIE